MRINSFWVLPMATSSNSICWFFSYNSPQRQALLFCPILWKRLLFMSLVLLVKRDLCDLPLLHSKRVELDQQCLLWRLCFLSLRLSSYQAVCSVLSIILQVLNIITINTHTACLESQQTIFVITTILFVRQTKDMHLQLADYANRIGWQGSKVGALWDGPNSDWLLGGDLGVIAQHFEVFEVFAVVSEGVDGLMLDGLAGHQPKGEVIIDYVAELNFLEEVGELSVEVAGNMEHACVDADHLSQLSLSHVVEHPTVSKAVREIVGLDLVGIDVDLLEALAFVEVDGCLVVGHMQGFIRGISIELLVLDLEDGHIVLTMLFVFVSPKEVRVVCSSGVGLGRHEVPHVGMKAWVVLNIADIKWCLYLSPTTWPQSMNCEGLPVQSRIITGPIEQAGCHRTWWYQYPMCPSCSRTLRARWQRTRLRRGRSL